VLGLLLTTLAFLPAGISRADNSWGAWPAGGDPTTIGVKLIQNLLARTPPNPARGLPYQETCAGYGAIRFAVATNNQDLLNQIIPRYQAIIAAGSKLPPKPNNVDNSIFGILPLELYHVTQNQAYLTLGLSYADAQFATLNSANLSSETRYHIDDAYKLSVMQILAFHATKKPAYADNAVKEFTAFIDQFQQPTGLFFHTPIAPIYWGRGNGWVAAGLAEVLLNLPTDNPQHAKIMTSYKAMMAGLLKVQAPDGRWRQVLDDPKAWEENSCTGLFIFALAVGVNQGWLDAATFRDPVKKAWTSLCGQLTPTADVKDVGVLTEDSADESYYLQRPRKDGDLHGQFAAIWAAWALLDPKPTPPPAATPAAKS
jgi:rhamnogalacturonyl hydrolase YesR